MTQGKWIESGGGPLVVVARAAASRWKGASSEDYDLACAVEDYTGVIDGEFGQAWVLNDEPLRTCVLELPAGLAIVRWRYAPDEPVLLASVQQFQPSAQQIVESVDITPI